MPGTATVGLIVADSLGLQADTLSFSATTDWPTGVHQHKPVTSYELVGNYPNPFNPSTTIAYNVAEVCSSIKLQVYSVVGQLVAEHEMTNTSAGTHHFNFDASDLPAGVYMYRLVFENTSGTIVSNQKKFTLLK